MGLNPSDSAEAVVELAKIEQLMRSEKENLNAAAVGDASGSIVDGSDGFHSGLERGSPFGGEDDACFSAGSWSQASK